MRGRVCRLVACASLAGLFATGCYRATPTPQAKPATTTESTSQVDAPGPNLSPPQVVRGQLAAFRKNSDDDAGIRAAFEFASPSNRQRVGGVEHFIRVVHHPLFRPILRHRTSEL